MKHIKIIILFIMTLFLPILIKASSNFNDGIKIANDYYNKFDNHDAYLRNDTGSSYYNYVSGVSKKESGFITGGFLSEQEYLITNTNNNSYLAPGIEYWLIDGKRLYFVLSNTNIKQGTSGVRVTEFTKHNVKVNGKGTYTNPWYFSGIYKVTARSSDLSMGKIEPGYEVQYADMNGSVDIKYISTSGYTYDKIVCSSGQTNKISDGLIRVSNINQNVDCTLYFDTNTYVVAFNKNDSRLNGTMADQTHIIDQHKKLSKNNYQKTGYHFVNWSRKSDGSGEKFIDEQDVINLTRNNGEIINLYANTAPNQYGLDINGDYNNYGKNYNDGSHIKSFDLKIVSESGKVLYEATNILDYCSVGTCTNIKGEYNATYYITNVKYRDQYKYDDSSLRNDSSQNESNLEILTDTGTKFAFKHTHPGDIWFSINTVKVEPEPEQEPTPQNPEPEKPKTCSTGYYLDKESNECKPITYGIKYVMETDETCTTCPTEAVYDETFKITKPVKKVKVNYSVASGINVDYEDATVGKGGGNIKYPFGGWTITNMDSTTHYINKDATNETELYEVRATKYKNLKSTKTPKEKNKVKFESTYDELNLSLPSLEKDGFDCKWNTSDISGITEISSGGEVTINNLKEVTFTAKCIELNPITHQFVFRPKDKICKSKKNCDKLIKVSNNITYEAKNDKKDIYITIPKNKNWKIEFYVSGELETVSKTAIDIHVVGGGGGGGGSNEEFRAGGGGGGYTKTCDNKTLAASTKYTIQVGAGGSGGEKVTSSSVGNNGSDGERSLFKKVGADNNLCSANGGHGGKSNPPSDNEHLGHGGSGGSGGGGSGVGWEFECSTSGHGGKNGNDGKSTIRNYGTGASFNNGGSGQGTTTRDFSETTGILRAGGGGGRNGADYCSGEAGNGGKGGGGQGGYYERGLECKDENKAIAGTDHFGGGGGAGAGSGSCGAGKRGGSGIVIIRNKR